MNRKIITVFLLLSVLALITSTITVNEVQAKSKNHNKVDKFLRANTIGGDKMRDLCEVNIITDYGKANASLTLRECVIPEPEPDDNQTIPDDNQTIPPVEDCQTNEQWNGTHCVPNPTIPICDTGEFYNATSEMCEPIVIPEPDDNQTTEEPPAPSNETAKIIGVGDVECSGDGVKVLNQIKKENPNLALILGDLCYDSSTSNFLSTWGTLGNQLACMIGNHDAEEDGSAALYQAFLEYCGNDYFIKNANYLIQGLNTNDNTAGLQSQSQQFTARLKNATFMEGIDVVIVASHKPICETPPNSHHPIDEDSKSKAVNEAFCEPIKEAVNPTVKLIFLNGHNHIMASGQQNGISYVESGAGGKSHYECGTNNIFTFCNNTKFGYWMIEIEPDGTIQSGFKDINGGMVN